jgi:alpha-L-arabinofuranosidase
MLLLSPLLTSCQQTAEPSITTITIGPEVLHTNVKRLGINLSGQSFYDSGQMLRNLTFRNPGFEGETWQSILHCKSATANTCTDENQYAVWPAGFLDGAHYELLSGPNRGAAGTVRTNSAAANGQGVTLTLADSPKQPPSAGDFILVRLDKPGNAQAGWWTSLEGGATLATEFHDLPPNTAGRQALRVEAAGDGQSATISSYFNSFEGRSFVQLNGNFVVSFRAKFLSGANYLTVKVERLDTKHGAHTFLTKLVTLSPEWRDYSFIFNGFESPSDVGTVALTFSFDHTAALLDDAALTARPDRDNPTAFRNEVVQTLRDLRPGVLRYMDNGNNFGSSIDNLLAPPFGRQRTGASTQLTVQEDIPLGLHEFLTLAKAVGAEPWFSMPPGMSPGEAANLVEYLSGASTTRYGAIRASLGQPEPWTTVFPQVHLELGNEQWNARSFAGSTINDPTAYGRRAESIFQAIRASKSFVPGGYDMIIGSWATVPWWTQQEIASSSGFDSIAVAPYLFNDFSDASTTEAIFGPMLAEPEMIDSRNDGYMTQTSKLLGSPLDQLPALAREQLLGLARVFSPRDNPRGTKGSSAPGTQSKAAKPTNLAVYETNIGSMTGSAAITQADIDHAIPSMGAGLAVADHMLLMLRDLGVTTQCLFALPEYVNNFTAPGPKRMIPLWGAVVDMGGPTNLRRPQFLAEQLANQAILPNMLTTHVRGPAHTWDQPLSPNDKIKLDHAQLIQTFAFADGARHSLILLNLSRTETIPVVFAGLSKPAALVEESRLTAEKITDSNEQTQTVTVHHEHITDFDPERHYRLPPFSMTVLTWDSAR